MKKIAIGTCVPGSQFETYAPQFAEMGYESLSVNFHMSLGDTDMDRLASVARDFPLPISALGYYCNALQYEDHEKTLAMCIDMAEKFGTRVVSTFAGALEGESVDASMPRFKEVFGRLCRRAEDKGVRIAIENCPMGGTWQHNTCNIGFNPRAWDMMFDAVPSPALGLEWEPTHQMCQLIDPIACARKYAPRFAHMHGKDASIRKDILDSVGIIGPVEAVRSCFPGFGDCDWRKIFEILRECGYESVISVEGWHDAFFADDREMVGQRHALNYLKRCREMDDLQ